MTVRWMLLGAMAWMLWHAQVTMDAAASVCRLFVTAVLPGLFPYMVLSLMVMSRSGGGLRPAGKEEKHHHLSGGAETVNYVWICPAGVGPVERGRETSLQERVLRSLSRNGPAARLAGPVYPEL